MQGIPYAGTTSWYLDPGDRWSVAALCADVCYAARVSGYKLTLGGQALDPGALACEVLTDGDTVDLVEA